MEAEIAWSIVRSAAIRLFVELMDVIALWIMAAIILFGSLGLCELMSANLR